MSLALHAFAIAAVPQIAPLRSTSADAAPMTVRLTVPQRIAEPEGPVAPPAPVEVARRKPQPNARPLPPQPPAQPPQRQTPVMTKQAPVQAAVAAQLPTPGSMPSAPSQASEAAVMEAPAPRAAVEATALEPPDFKAAYLDNPRPDYPALSKRYREQGKVLLRVHVSAAGAVQQVELHSSSGWPRLDRAAEEAVRAWRFVPANRSGAPVPGWVIVPLNFTLEG